MIAISIIIPVFNAEKYLSQCIDSIIAQTYTDWELLLVDDGSTDGSGDLCDSYKKNDERIRVFHKANGGVSSSRNMGLDNAKGEYITFADSDDWLEPHAFQTYMDAFANYDIDVVRTGFYHEHENGVSEKTCISKNIICHNTWDMFGETERSQYYSFVWNTCIKRSCIGKLRFNEEICWLEDHTFIYQCYMNCKSMAILNVPTYHYVRRDENSLAHIKSPDIVLKAADIELKLKRELLDGRNKTLEQEVESIYAYRLHSVIRLLYLGNYAFSERREFSRYERLTPELKFKEERIFFAQGVPFIIKDLFLKLLFCLKRKK